MTDEELLDQIKEVTIKLEQLIQIAEHNSKYYTKSRLNKAYIHLFDALESLDAHINMSVCQYPSGVMTIMS